MKHLLVLSLLSLFVCSASFAGETKENCDALAENNLRTNPKAGLNSVQAKSQSKKASAARK